jgi:hypothetical protein
MVGSGPGGDEKVGEGWIMGEYEIMTGGLRVTEGSTTG